MNVEGHLSQEQFKMFIEWAAYHKYNDNKYVEWFIEVVYATQNKSIVPLLPDY